MIKEHNDTGLKYLCQTSKQDPHTYAGSGKYWLRHLAKHGENFTTTILEQTENKQVLQEKGRHYSKLHNVVESDDWANLTIEQGDGGWINDQTGKTWKVKDPSKMGKHGNQWINDDGSRAKAQSERMKANNPGWLPRTQAQQEAASRNSIIGCEASKKRMKIVEADGTELFFESKMAVTKHCNISYDVLNYRIEHHKDYNGIYFYEQ